MAHKVLIIEDETDILENLGELLTYAGYETAQASDGLAGIELAKVIFPDIIVCDVNMPKMGGYAVLSYLQQDPILAATPLIFLTANSDFASMRKGMELGADDYIIKPISSQVLLKAIASRLARQARIVENLQIKQPDVDKTTSTAVESFKALTYQNLSTHLPDRLHLQNYFNDFKVETSIHPQPLTLVLFELDQYHWIKSSLGDQCVEKLLHQTFERIDQLFEAFPNIEGKIAYFDSNRFGGIIVGSASQLMIQDLLQEFKKKIELVFHIEEHEIYITLSLGYAEYPLHDHAFDGLVFKANAALTKSKARSGSYLSAYTDSQLKTMAYQRQIASDLSKILENDQLVILYQPKVCLHNNRLIGAEALIRWHHPRLGMIAPHNFITLAEEMGNIIPIGAAVVKKACSAATDWHNCGGNPISIAVNISPRQLYAGGLIELVMSTLESVNLSPSLLELEVTETILLHDNDILLEDLKYLRKVGVNIAVDDFGTGYSGFKYIQTLPITTLKIDRSYIQNIHLCQENQAIVKAIINMAHMLGIQVVAEGVEIFEERQFLECQECDIIQGYLISPPVTFDKFKGFLKS